MDPAKVFFYGTLMRGFPLRRQVAVDDRLRFLGRGSISGSLFDLGRYPGAVAVGRGRVHGEAYEMIGPPDDVLAILDEAEGYRAAADSPYVRAAAPVMLDVGLEVSAWVYFYNQSVWGPTPKRGCSAPSRFASAQGCSTLVGAVRIHSGDYRAYLAEATTRVRR